MLPSSSAFLIVVNTVDTSNTYPVKHFPSTKLLGGHDPSSNTSPVMRHSPSTKVLGGHNPSSNSSPVRRHSPSS